MQLTQTIVRHRYGWFIVAALFLAASFNGQWQIGPDSAAYRQMARQLARGNGYEFRQQIVGVREYTEESASRYPGLPYILAGIERIFGRGDLAPLVFTFGCAILVLLLTHRLMRMNVEPWLVVFVVAGVALNARFLQYSNEIIADMPFLLGVMMSLLGYELLRRGNGLGATAGATALAFSGLLLAAILRPLFWSLALAMFAACVWVIVTGRPGLRRYGDVPVDGSRRWRFGLLLCLMTIAGGIFLLALDVRVKNDAPSKVYENRMLAKVMHLVGSEMEGGKPGKTSESPLSLLGKMLGTELPTAFFGTRVGYWGVGMLISLVIIIGGVALAWRNVLWGGLVLVAVMTICVWGAIPRYFLMILPLLLAGWGMTFHWAARRFLRGRWRDFGLFMALGVVTGFNIAVATNFIRIQRGLSKPFGSGQGWHGLHYVGFLPVFNDGKWMGIRELSSMINAKLKPGQKAIGPEATVMTYLSERSVYPPIAAVPNEGYRPQISIGVFPTPNQKFKVWEYDADLKYLMNEGHIRQSPGEDQILAVQEGGYVLAKMEIVPWSARPERPERRERDGEERKVRKHRRGEDDASEDSSHWWSP